MLCTTVVPPPARWHWLTAPFDRPAARAGMIALIAVLALLFPAITDDQANIDAAGNATAYAALALGLNIVVGFCGLLDLGYAAFFAIGAYAYGILTSWQITPHWSGFWSPFEALGLVQKVVQNGQALVHFTVSFWLMIPASGVIAAFFGVLFGAPTLRLRGDYLAIVTLGFGEIVPIVVRNWTGLTNGAAGLNGIASPTLFSYHFGIDATPYYYVGIGICRLPDFCEHPPAREPDRPRLDGHPRRRNRGERHGHQPDPLQAARLRHGRRFRRHGGHLLYRQAADRDAGHVRLSGLRHDPRHGRAGRPRQRLGCRRSVPIALQLLQSWFLGDLTQWVNALGSAIHNDYLSSLDLTQASELIFGIILVTMMLYRREGLIPANRRQRALSFEQQHATVQTHVRAEDVSLSKIGGAGYQHGPGDQPLLDIKDLTVRFGGLVALNKVNITVPAGSVVAVIGPNGSGKSTLFNAITGLTRAGEGSIRFHGKEILGLPPHQILKAGIARTFQNIRLFGTLTVAENIMIGQHARLKAGPITAIFRSPKSSPRRRPRAHGSRKSRRSSATGWCRA